MQLLDEAFLLLHAPLLESGALREDHSIAPAVDLDHLEAQAAAHLLGQAVAAVVTAAVRTDAYHLGEGDKGVHPFHVHQEATSVIAGDLAFKVLAGFEPLLEDAPALFATGLVDGEQHLALRRLRMHDKD